MELWFGLVLYLQLGVLAHNTTDLIDVPIRCFIKRIQCVVSCCISEVLGSLQSLNKKNNIHKNEILAAVPDESDNPDRTKAVAIHSLL